MNHIFTFILFITLGSMQAQTQFNFNQDHIALQVGDLELAAMFYSDILGLKEMDNAGLGNDIKWFQLNDMVQIHLIRSEQRIDKTKGIHFALNTDDLMGFMKFLESKSVKFENWTGEINTSNTRPDGIKQIYLQDPDGYWLEINDNRLK